MLARLPQMMLRAESWYRLKSIVVVVFPNWRRRTATVEPLAVPAAMLRHTRTVVPGVAVQLIAMLPVVSVSDGGLPPMRPKLTLLAL